VKHIFFLTFLHSPFLLISSFPNLSLFPSPYPAADLQSDVSSTVGSGSKPYLPTIFYVKLWPAVSSKLDYYNDFIKSYKNGSIHSNPAVFHMKSERNAKHCKEVEWHLGSFHRQFNHRQVPFSAMIICIHYLFCQPLKLNCKLSFINYAHFTFHETHMFDKLLGCSLAKFSTHH